MFVLAFVLLVGGGCWFNRREITHGAKKACNALLDVFVHSKDQITHGLGTGRIQHVGRTRNRKFYIQSERGKISIPSFNKDITVEIYLCPRIDAPRGLVADQDNRFDDFYSQGTKLIQYGSKCLATYRYPQDYLDADSISVVITDYVEDTIYHIPVEKGEFLDFEGYLNEFRMCTYEE